VSGDSVRVSNRFQVIGCVINDISAPKNLKALQRLLGMFQYWKKLIPYFSKNTHHMRSLLKKDAAFSWTAQCQSELDCLKSCLVSDPILKPFDSNREIIIHIDGSSHGLGFAVLQCGDDNNLHAVKYGSYATTPHQAKYTADDLEAVALMYALRSIESVALLKHVTIITDNSHVLHIKDWTPVNNWQRRMLTYILQFNLTILFIKGSRNFLADALSIMYQDSTVQERADHQATFMHETDDVVLPVTTRSMVRTALNGDRDLQRARQISDSPDAPHGSASADGRGVNGSAEHTTVLLPEPASDGNKTRRPTPTDRRMKAAKGLTHYQIRRLP